MALLPGGRIGWKRNSSFQFALETSSVPYPSTLCCSIDNNPNSKSSVEVCLATYFFPIRQIKSIAPKKSVKMVQHRQRLPSTDSSSITSSSSTSSTMWRRCRSGSSSSVRWPTCTPMLLLLLLVSVETLSLATVTTATRMHYIHWNTTNPM